jgi:hypothetical protein
MKLAAAAWLVIGIAGCHRNDKAEKLAALESAYHSGVFTKEEYNAKKAGLLGTPVAVPSPVASSPAAPTTVPSPTPAAPTPVATPTVPVASPPPARKANTETQPEPAPAAGCEDSESNAGKEKGVQERFYPAPIEAVKKATQAVLQNLDFAIHLDTSHDIEASKRRHISAIVGAGGERLLLHFEKARRGNQTGTLVKGETRKQLVGRIAQKSWTNAVLAQIGCQLRAR